MPRMTAGKRTELESFWRAHLEGWRRSDLNQREYCERHGLPLKRFGNWRAKLRHEDPAPNVGGGDHAVQQQALRVDQDMALLALDQLARVEAGRVDADPPFSTLFTLWLSMMQAVGLASRSAFSRHLT